MNTVKDKMNKFQLSDKTAILLLAFGGPDSPSAIEPFLKNILGGRNMPPEKLAQIKKRYLQIGGKSPLAEITFKQATLLEAALGDKFKVFVGMRYWHPFINDTIANIKNLGFKQIIAIPMTPYYCNVSTGAYKKDFDQAIKKYEENTFKDKFIMHWYDHPMLWEAFADTIKEAIAENPLSEIQIIFSVHSVPEQIINQGDPYLKQINETIQGILKNINPAAWYLGFQSKSGGHGNWLGPDVKDILEKISASSDKSKQILLAPIGFISEHVETLYDIDIEYKKIAEEKGLKFKRAKALNENPKFIKVLEQIVKDTRCN
ncbi:ferrochelatase [Candidatus Poribacteria bacterium]|nr:ferrochelatase [Candidatus Poribacteria bacterium]